MKFLLDMNMSPLLGDFLCRHGFDAIHWSRVGAAWADDRELVEWGRNDDRIIITNDLDFGTILAIDRTKAPSVIQVRRLDLLPSALFPVLLQVFEKYQKELEQGALVTVDEKRIRVRLLPMFV